MFAAIESAVIIDEPEVRAVTVEVTVTNELPAFVVVDMADDACRELRDRVRAAIMSSALDWPTGRVSISLIDGDPPQREAGRPPADPAPASNGTTNRALDLPIALAILAASHQLSPNSIERFGAVGALDPDGTLRSVDGMIALAGSVAAPAVIVPASSARDAAMPGPGEILPAGMLRNTVERLETSAGQPHQASNRRGDAAEHRSTGQTDGPVRPPRSRQPHHATRPGGFGR